MEKILSDNILKSIAQASSMYGTEIGYYSYIKNQAKKYDISYEELLSAVRKINIDYSYRNSKNNTKHYHSTSLSNFEDIIKTGRLLSRKEREKIGISTSNLQFSSSDNVQFSRDYFNEKGELVNSGYSAGRGASGADVTFVIGSNIYDEQGFDATFKYPTVESLNIKNSCVAIIAKNEDVKNKINEILRANGYDEITVFLNKEWNSNISLEVLEKMKKEKEQIRKKNNIIDLHNLTVEERFNYAQKAILNYSKDSDEYKYYLTIINQNKPKRKINVDKKMLEQMLGIHLDVVRGYQQQFIDGKEVYVPVIKTTQQLSQEHGELLKKIEELYENSELDINTKIAMQTQLSSEIENLKQQVITINNSQILNSLSTHKPMQGDEKKEKIDNIPTEFNEIYNNIIEEKLSLYLKEKYDYDDMSVDEKEKFDKTVHNYVKEEFQRAKVEKDSLIDMRNKAWEKMKEKYKTNPNLDLETLIRVQEFNEMQNHQEDEIENVESSSRRFI